MFRFDHGLTLFDHGLFAEGVALLPMALMLNAFRLLKLPRNVTSDAYCHLSFHFEISMHKKAKVQLSSNKPQKAHKFHSFQRQWQVGYSISSFDGSSLFEARTISHLMEPSRFLSTTSLALIADWRAV
jgi:hypothetical protein